MKHTLKKSFSAVLLVLTLLLCAVSCAQNDPIAAADQTGTTNTDTTAEATLSSVKASGTPTLGNMASTGLTYYIRLDGIDGESTDSAHVKWINVLDFSHSTTLSPEATYGAYDPIVFTHKVDKATPLFQSYCMNGRSIRSGEFHAVGTVGGQATVQYQVAFSDLRVIDCVVKTVTDENGSACLLEEVTMLAEKETVSVPSESGPFVYTSDSFPYYIKIDGIEGNSTNSAHAKWINVASFSHGATQNNQTGTLYEAIASSFEPVVLTHRVDCATPKIQAGCMNGMVIRSGEFHATKSVAGKQIISYSVKLSGIKIAKATVKTARQEDGSSCLMEEVTLLADKETWVCAPVGLDIGSGGASEATYDQSKKT